MNPLGISHLDHVSVLVTDIGASLCSFDEISMMMSVLAGFSIDFFFFQPGKVGLLDRPTPGVTT
jgi:hypothetical protein